MVAVHVQSAPGHALPAGGAVGVAARNDDDIDAVQHGLQEALRQLPCNDKQCFATGRLVAMLLADQHHGGFAAGLQGTRVCGACTRQHQRLERLAVL